MAKFVGVAFYPKGIAAREQLSYYATQFDTVELDNTFYRTPAIICPKCRAVVSYLRSDLGYLANGQIDRLSPSSLRLLDAQRNHVRQIPHCNAACSLPSSAGARFLRG